MFLRAVMERNRPLVRLGIEWQQKGVILPDTYLLDYDTIVDNARQIKKAGDANGVENFFMLKQIGRNPLIARALTELGFGGAVCVDFREALPMASPSETWGIWCRSPVPPLQRSLQQSPGSLPSTRWKRRRRSARCAPGWVCTRS